MTTGVAIAVTAFAVLWVLPSALGASYAAALFAYPAACAGWTGPWFLTGNLSVSAVGAVAAAVPVLAWHRRPVQARCWTRRFRSPQWRLSTDMPKEPGRMEALAVVTEEERG